MCLKEFYYSFLVKKSKLNIYVDSLCRAYFFTHTSIRLVKSKTVTEVTRTFNGRPECRSRKYISPTA